MNPARLRFRLVSSNSTRRPRQPITLIFFFNDTATTEIYTLSLHDALPISELRADIARERVIIEHALDAGYPSRSEEHTSELQSPDHLVCRLLLEKKKLQKIDPFPRLFEDFTFDSKAILWIRFFALGALCNA